MIKYRYYEHDTRTGDKIERTEAFMRKTLGKVLFLQIQETGNVSCGTTVWHCVKGK